MMQEKVVSLIGAPNPLLRAINVLKSLPEKMAVTFVTDARWLLVRAGTTPSTLYQPYWEKLRTLERNHPTVYQYNTVPMSHEGVPAEVWEVSEDEPVD